MSEVDTRALALRPWFALLDACEGRRYCPPARHADSAGAQSPLARARRVLNGLAAGVEAPVPAQIGASQRIYDEYGRLRDTKPAQALRQMWLDRDAVLRLGVWGVIERLANVPLGESIRGAPFDGLMALISGQAHEFAPVLQPSRKRGGADAGFAGSEAAASFFNHRLRKSLRNLARLYDDRGASFARWVLPDYVPGVSPLAPWSQAWTLSVVATYVDWLHQASGGSPNQALRLIWHEHPKRFRPPQGVVRPEPEAQPGDPRPAALPTDADRIHFDLLLQPVLAQLLDYDALRWIALQDGHALFSVALCTKTLGQAESRRKDPRLRDYSNVTMYRGLTVVQIYSAAAIQYLGGLLAPSRPEQQTANADDSHFGPVGALAHSERYGPGQRPNVEALVEWQSDGDASMGGRFVAVAGDAAPKPAARWTRAVQPQRALPSDGAVQFVELAWEPPAAGSPSLALGRLDPWPALPEDAEWVELALSVHCAGRWLGLEPEFFDDRGGRSSEGHAGPRGSLYLSARDVGALAAMGIAPEALRLAATRPDRLRWVGRQAGLGVFVAGLIDLGWPASEAAHGHAT